MISFSSEYWKRLHHPNRSLEASWVSSSKRFFSDPCLIQTWLIHRLIVDVKNKIQKLQKNALDSNTSWENPEKFVSWRNNRIKEALRETWLEVDDYLHPSTWAPYLLRNDLQNSVLHEEIRNFFLAPGNLLQTWSRIVTWRGKHYYFQFPGIGVSGNPLSLKDASIFQQSGIPEHNHQLFCQSLVDHYNNIERLRNVWFNRHEDIIEAPPSANSKAVKRSILVILDHEKNILLFLINALTILLDSNFLNPEAKGKLVFNREQSRSFCIKNPQWYLEFKTLQDELLGKKHYLIEALCKSISSVEKNFVGILVHSQCIVWSLSIDAEVQKIIELIEIYFNFLAGVIHHGKKTGKKKNVAWDTYWQIGISRVMRFSREEDDIRAMLISASSLAHQIMNAHGRYADLEIFWILYGGVEFPFILENTLRSMGFRWQSSIRLSTYSMYDVKNITGGLTLSDYPDVTMFDAEWWPPKKGITVGSAWTWAWYAPGTKEAPSAGKIAVILDDNIFSGDTLLGFEKLLQKTWNYDHIISQVSTIMLDVRNKNRIQQDSRFLHNQIVHTGSVLPVWTTNTGKYINPLTAMIGKRVQRVSM